MEPSYWWAKRSIPLAVNPFFSKFPVTNSPSSHQWGDLALARSYRAATQSWMPIGM